MCSVHVWWVGRLADEGCSCVCVSVCVYLCALMCMPRSSDQAIGNKSHSPDPAIGEAGAPGGQTWLEWFRH